MYHGEINSGFFRFGSCPTGLTVSAKTAGIRVSSSWLLKSCERCTKGSQHHRVRSWCVGACTNHNMAIKQSLQVFIDVELQRLQRAPIRCPDSYLWFRAEAVAKAQWRRWKPKPRCTSVCIWWKTSSFPLG